MDAPTLVNERMLKALDSCLHALQREQVIRDLGIWTRIDGCLIGRRFSVGRQPVTVSTTAAPNATSRHSGTCHPSSCEGIGTRTMTLYGRDCAPTCRDDVGSDDAFVVHRLAPAIAVLSGIAEQSLASSMLGMRGRSGIQVPRGLYMTTSYVPAAAYIPGSTLIDALFGDGS